MKQKGITLIELLLTVVVLAIVVGIAVPSFDSTIKRNSIVSNANQLIGALNFARVEATKRGASVYIASTNSAQSNNRWGQGYVVYLDADNDATYDAGEELRLYKGVSSGITLNGASTQLRFRPSGFASAAMSLKVCSSDTKIAGQTISISLAGRVSGSSTTCP